MENPELAALREENRLLRDLARQHEVDRDAKDFYERLLTEIGKSIGCEHLDERLPSCVAEEIQIGKDAIGVLRTIVRRNGCTTQQVFQIEKWLKEKNLGGVRRG